MSPPCCSPSLALLWEAHTQHPPLEMALSISGVLLIPCPGRKQILGICALLLWECRGAEGALQQS